MITEKVYIGKQGNEGNEIIVSSNGLIYSNVVL